MTQYVRSGVLLVLASAVLLGIFDYIAPLEATSVAVYAGALIAVTGLVCLVRPIKLLAIRTRRVAGLVCVAGVTIFVVALCWPAATLHGGGLGGKLDEFLPEYNFYERHEVRVHASPSVTAAALKAVTFGDIQGYATLMQIRMAAGGVLHRPGGLDQLNVLEAMARPGSGFLLLHDDGREIVMGMAGRPWSGDRRPMIQTVDEYRAFDEPESVKVAFNLVVSDDGNGWSRIVTETRVRGTDDAGRRIMARYWRVIYPGSGMIRRMWLNAARSRAELGS